MSENRYPLTIYFPDGTVWEFYLPKQPRYREGDRVVVSLTLPGTYIATNYVVATADNGFPTSVLLERPDPEEDKDRIRYVE